MFRLLNHMTDYDSKGGACLSVPCLVRYFVCSKQSLAFGVQAEQSWRDRNDNNNNNNNRNNNNNNSNNMHRLRNSTRVIATVLGLVLHHTNHHTIFHTTITVLGTPSLTFLPRVVHFCFSDGTGSFH